MKNGYIAVDEGYKETNGVVFRKLDDGYTIVYEDEFNKTYNIEE